MTFEILYKIFVLVSMIRQANCAEVSSLVSKDVFDEYKFSTDLRKQSHECEVPYSSAIFTLTNKYHFDLVKLQVSVLRKIHTFSCINPTYYVVTLDIESFNLCEDLSVFTCIRGSKTDLQPSDFGETDYHVIIFLKWRIIKTALMSFDYVFLFDNDVLFLQNPWVDVLEYIDDYDLWYQWERGKDDINAGQLLFRNTSTSHEVLNYILSHESDKRKYDILDQGFLAEALKKYNVESKFLPKSYVGHCSWTVKDVGSQHILSLVTYHASCTGTAKQKLITLTHIHDNYLYYVKFPNSEANLKIIRPP